MDSSGQFYSDNCNWCSVTGASMNPDGNLKTAVLWNRKVEVISMKGYKYYFVFMGIIIYSILIIYLL